MVGDILVVYDGFNRHVRIQQQTTRELTVVEIRSKDQLEQVLNQLGQMTNMFSALSMSALGLDDEGDV